jgi:hypothetical protein
MFLFTQYAVACKQTASINSKNSTLTRLDDHHYEIHAPARCPPLSPAIACKAEREKELHRNEYAI